MGEKSPERIALEARAESLGVSFAWNIGDDTLAERVAEALAAANPVASGQTSAPDGASNAPGPSGPSAAAGAMDGASAATTPQPTPANAMPIFAPQVVEVIGPRRGRWRAGRHFTPEPTFIPVADLTEEQFIALVEDPKLTVTARDADET